jgi:UDP-glucose 4-epimerase
MQPAEINPRGGYTPFLPKSHKMPSRKKVLITGVGGFIGRTLAHYLSSRRYLVYGLDRVPAENAHRADLAEYTQLALPNSQFEGLLRRWQPDAILHCAGGASVERAMEDPLLDYAEGPALTFSLLDSTRKVKPDCAFVLLSSAAVYGNPERLPVSEASPVRPISTYGYHKWQSEIICQEYAQLFGMCTISVRIFSAYGPGLRRQVIWDIVRKALTQPEVRLQGTGQESRDFIHVQDIAQGLEAILSSVPPGGSVYNLASGRETKIADLAALILRQLGISSPPIFPGQLPQGTPKNWQADIAAISKLGFKPQISIADGITDFVQWYRTEIQGA